MISEKKNIIITGFVFGIVGMLLSLALFAETSPLHEFFLSNVSAPNLWRMLNFPVLIVLLITKIDSRPFALVMIFFQWFIIGLTGAYLWQMVKFKAPLK